jgi:hypothetical protein
MGKAQASVACAWIPREGWSGRCRDRGELANEQNIFTSVVMRRSWRRRESTLQESGDQVFDYRLCWAFFAILRRGALVLLLRGVHSGGRG